MVAQGRGRAVLFFMAGPGHSAAVWYMGSGQGNGMMLHDLERLGSAQLHVAAGAPGGPEQGPCLCHLDALEPD